MKTIRKNTKNEGLRRIGLSSAYLKHNQPFLERKLDEANQLLKKVGLPKELEK